MRCGLSSKFFDHLSHIKTQQLNVQWRNKYRFHQTLNVSLHVYTRPLTPSNGGQVCDRARALSTALNTCSWGTKTRLNMCDDSSCTGPLTRINRGFSRRFSPEWDDKIYCTAVIWGTVAATDSVQNTTWGRFQQFCFHY